MAGEVVGWVHGLPWQWFGHTSRQANAPKKILACLAEHAHKPRDPVAWPSITTLAKEASCSANTVRTALHELQARGAITIATDYLPRRPEEGFYGKTNPWRIDRQWAGSSVRTRQELDDWWLPVRAKLASLGVTDADDVGVWGLGIRKMLLARDPCHGADLLLMLVGFFGLDRAIAEQVIEFVREQRQEMPHWGLVEAFNQRQLIAR